MISVGLAFYLLFVAKNEFKRDSFRTNDSFWAICLVCWKFVWPPLLAAMEERAKKIEQGLKDSEASAKK